MKSVLTLAALSLWLLSFVEAGQIKLAEDGKATATIVTPENAPGKIELAALDLQKYIERICGVKLPIQADGKQVNGTGLYIGECEGAPICTLPKSGASWEGYVIAEKEGSLYFTGLNPTPVAFGVYSFIEDDLGVRWFAPGDLWEKVPKSTTPGSLSVEARPRTVIPQTSPRVWSGHNWAPIWEEWSRRNKTGLSEVISKRNFQNKIHEIFPVEKYAKEHPEYYPLMTNGKRFFPPKRVPNSRADRHWRPCESNPEVQRIVIDYIRNYFDENPDQDSFSVGMDDISHICCCPNCRAMDDAPDSYEYRRFSDRHYKFVNIIAKEVAKTHPDKYIGTLIYSIARQLPKDVPKLEPNVFGFITETCAAWWMPGLKQSDHELTAEWRKRVQHLSRYDYYGFASMAPRYFPHNVDEQMKFDKSLGLEGMYIEVYTFLPLTTPMIWQISKLQWDASLDTDKLLDEFMTIYGAAKPQMARFWDLLEKSYQVDRPGRGKSEHRKIRNQALAISPEDLDKAFAILQEAEQVADDAQVKARIAIHRDALKLSAYIVRPYAYNLQIQNIEVKSQAEADTVIELADKLEASKVGRDEFIAGLKKRKDLIGLNINGFQKRGTLMQFGSFPMLENSAMTGFLQAVDWYVKNRPAELETRINSINSASFKEMVGGFAKLVAKGQPPRNLLVNGDFEIRGETRDEEQGKDMEGWRNAGCPKGWHSWARSNQINVQVVAEGRSGNAVKVSNCYSGGSLIQAANAEPGGLYLLSCYMKLKGGRATLGVRFRTKKGNWCKTRDGEVSVVVSPKNEDEWALVMLLVPVPTGGDAGQIAVMPGFGNQGDGDYILMDDFVLYRLK